MIWPNVFLQSPLGRNPRLLMSKALGRLGIQQRPLSFPDAPDPALVYPQHWRTSLEPWLRGFSVRPGPHPFNRVFAQDFDEELLLELCRKGPRADERGLRADVKLIWEYSRAHPLVTNAWAGQENLEHCLAFLRRWLASNESIAGPAWACPMDVSIRAINWIVADVLYSGNLGANFGRAEWSKWLWRSGRTVWCDPEARLISSNHYLANLLGLYVIGSCFPDDDDARKWRVFAEKEFPRALLAQTRSDGGLNEASLRYHAYVTEMALLFRLAQNRPFSDSAEQRLAAMCRIAADFRDATGDVFPFGDDDTGRVLALDAACDTGRADILLALARLLLGGRFTPSAEAVYPESGWWIKRAGEFVCALEFGGVGCLGAGAHAHNDDLSICVEWKGRPVFVDPGSFIYTGDRATRDRFRSARQHNVVLVEGREPRELGPDPFRLPGADRALDFSESLAGISVTRRCRTAIAHARTLRLTADGLLISDQFSGEGTHLLEWRFHCHPGIRVEQDEHGFVLNTEGAGILRLRCSGNGLDFASGQFSFASYYGRSAEAPVCTGFIRTPLPLTVEWSLVGG